MFCSWLLSVSGCVAVDFEEATSRGIESIEKIQDEPGFKEVVLPVLAKLRVWVPGFRESLLRIVQEKSWWYVATEVDPKEKPQTDKFSVFAIGRQTKHDVEFYKPWMLKKKAVMRGWAILHEMVRGVGQDHGVDQLKSRELTRVLMLDKSLTAIKLQKRLSDLGFGSYDTLATYHFGSEEATYITFNKVNAEKLSFNKDFGPNKTTRETVKLEIREKFLSAEINGNLLEVETADRGKIAYEMNPETLEGLKEAVKKMRDWRDTLTFEVIESKALMVRFISDQIRRDYDGSPPTLKVYGDGWGYFR